MDFRPVPFTDTDMEFVALNAEIPYFGSGDFGIGRTINRCPEGLSVYFPSVTVRYASNDISRLPIHMR